jgi:hypothetical protein
MRAPAKPAKSAITSPPVPARLVCGKPSRALWYAILRSRRGQSTLREGGSAFTNNAHRS